MLTKRNKKQYVWQKKPVYGPIHHLTQDELVQILLSADYDTVLSLCDTNKNMHMLCQQDHFWHQKYQLDFPQFDVSHFQKPLAHPQNASTLAQPQNASLSWQQIYKRMYHAQQLVEKLLILVHKETNIGNNSYVVEILRIDFNLNDDVTLFLTTIEKNNLLTGKTNFYNKLKNTKQSLVIIIVGEI